jgi:SAM-dependent methyltransferase
MSEFWEEAFREKQMMWGIDPTEVAVEICELFKRNGFQKVLIPGFGYGRNAKVFYDSGFDVTGIEISGIAIDLARNLFGHQLRVFHGSVGEMPFDDENYDGIFCYALIHLLDAEERGKLIADCYRQLSDGGIMVFTAITKAASTYGAGIQLSKDRFRTKDGVELFFYDKDSIEEEFGSYGLKESVKIDEPVNGNPGKTTAFWKIVCQRIDNYRPIAVY